MTYRELRAALDGLSNEQSDVIDSVWQNGPQMAPKWVPNVVPITKHAKKKPAVAGSVVVEVRRLELLTPYMRSKCSTS